MERAFPINPVLEAMRYVNGSLFITFIKKDRVKEVREYGPVPAEIVYQWYYKQTVKEILSFYARSIRKKFNLISIKKV